MGRIFELERRRTAGDPQIADASQRVDQLFGEPVGEVLLIAIGAAVGIAYAANRRFAEATRFARRARELAEGDPALSVAIDDHLERYAVR